MDTFSLRKRLFGPMLVLSLLAVSPAVFAEDATVLWTEGDVQVQAPGSDTPSPAVPGASVPEGAVVVTAPGATAGLGMGGSLTGSAVMLNADSSATLKTLQDSARIEVANGSVFIKLAQLKKESKFEVVTPTAVATARGTGWLQSLEAVEVFDGTVSLTGTAGEEQTLAASEGYTINSGGALIKKYAVTETSQSAWTSFGQKVIASPYFNRVSAGDILRVRELIDAKRQSCGSTEKYPWDTEIAVGGMISASQVNELKTALTQPPFAQTSDFISAYMEPAGEIESGQPVRAVAIQLLSDAAKNASC